jgi:hypothetical protein
MSKVILKPPLRVDLELSCARAKQALRADPIVAKPGETNEKGNWAISCDEGFARGVIEQSRELRTGV